MRMILDCLEISIGWIGNSRKEFYVLLKGEGVH